MVDLSELRSGVCLAGQYTLEQRLGGDNGAAFFTASLEDGERALMKLVPASAIDASEQFATWQRTRHLRHPHLLHLREAGYSEVGGQEYLYALFDYPDDNLASAIEHGPISEQETGAVVDATLSALRYLHGQ